MKIHVGHTWYVLKHFLLFVLGCYVGITYGAFVPEATLWLDVCPNQSVNSSLCSVFPSEDCNNLRLLDVVVTRNYIVFATSFGLVKSASFALLMSEQGVAEKVQKIYGVLEIMKEGGGHSGGGQSVADMCET
jgi:hypothetical protein